ncbi:MAG: response regulator [Pirellulaceae bacterium]|nr:response regulator [Pirellulaceae bacterium]
MKRNKGGQLTQMVRLVDDLMDVSRISRDKPELRMELVLLAAILNSAVETSRPLIEQMGHQLTVTLPQQPLLVDADTTRLSQVFLNLLNNAAKYGDPGGHIQLNVERQGSNVVVTVKGSEFIVRLPVVIEASRPQEAGIEDEPAATKSSLRILIVDDNQDGANSLAMLLKIMGNDTRTAYDGQAGVDAAGEFRPDVMLLDIGLPKLNGYEVCRCIREQPWGKGVMRSP